MPHTVVTLQVTFGIVSNPVGSANGILDFGTIMARAIIFCAFAGVKFRDIFLVIQIHFTIGAIKSAFVGVGFSVRSANRTVISGANAGTILNFARAQMSEGRPLLFIVFLFGFAMVTFHFAFISEGLDSGSVMIAANRFVFLIHAFAIAFKFLSVATVAIFGVSDGPADNEEENKTETKEPDCDGFAFSFRYVRIALSHRRDSTAAAASYVR